MKIKRMIFTILADAGIILSAFLIFLVFADAVEPTKLYINASETGNYIFPLCIVSFASAVVYINIRWKGETERARSGIVFAALPHAVMILALLFLVLTVTNAFNHAMDFLTSDITKDVMTVYAVLSLLLSLELLDCASEMKK